MSAPPNDLEYRRTAAHAQRLRVGVFDSGVGGLSVLRELRRQLPGAALHYVADAAHAPYGERAPGYVRERSMAVAGFLRQQGCDLLVVACNTATAVAAEALRQRWADWPIVGVEPGIKPAAALTRNGRIGVLATEGTLRSDKFRLLAAAHAAHVQLVLQPGTGLAAALEAGDADAPEVRQRVTACCAPLVAEGVDTVVLGCTHYPFAAHHIRAAMGPAVQLIDTAEAIARRVVQLAPYGTAAAADAPPHAEVTLWTSDQPDTLGRIAVRWLGLHAPARAWDGAGHLDPAA